MNRKNNSLIPSFRKFLNKKAYGLRSREEYLREASAFIKWLGRENYYPNKNAYRKYLESLIDQKKKPKTISKNLSALKIFSDFLYKNKKTKTDLAHTLPHPILTKREINLLTVKEIERLRLYFSKDIVGLGLFETVLQTGLTISELSNLRRDQVRLVKGPKFGRIKLKSRSVPINNRLESILKNLIGNNSEYVFANRKGKPLNVRYIRYKLGKGFKALKLKNFYVNDLRHNFIYHQLQKGMGAGTVANWVGFKNLSSLNPFLKKLGRRSQVEGKIEEV